MKQDYIIGGLIVLVAIIGWLYFTAVQPSGGVPVANEYRATSTAAFASSTAAKYQLIKTGNSVLGSVTIASSSSKILTIWNATSTIDTASTSFVAFKASAAEGTYVFDAILTRGLIVALPADYNGNAIITYR